MLDENKYYDVDPTETQEWLDALNDILEEEGPARAKYILEHLNRHAMSEGVGIHFGRNTPYKNTIAPHQQPVMPGDSDMVERIMALIRWNAVAMVLRAGKKAPELGGHIASYASAAVLYEIGFHYFFHAKSENHGGDLLFIQGHSAPGIYARAFLEGRITLEQVENFRQEVETNGLSSYPHPWLMPDFWQFPTVSMGLGPIQAIYQARFLKYMKDRELIPENHRKVWAFLGDGEMDEPESLGALDIASRDGLDNLIFVINCNLQRLDGPVRGNGKIIQELEGIFRGAGWNVIKVVWGSRWDPLFANDKNGILQRRMEECVDGQYQSYKSNDGAYVREHFFGAYPELAEMVAHMSDEDIWHLNRGGHDQEKVYAAYDAAVKHKGSPTVILAKTIKGYGMGAAGEGMNITHQQKKMKAEHLRAFRDRFNIPIDDEALEEVPFYRPKDDSPEIQYLKKHREKLGGYLPARHYRSHSLTIPPLSAFDKLLEDSGDRDFSTTMAFVRFLGILLKDKALKNHIVPIIPDEARTFGMEGMFRQYGIYSPVGQLYTPEDHHQVMSYKEAKDGMILEEGINEAGAFCSFMAAGTSYANHDIPMIPFYIYYSMFGFQRIADLAWAAGDMQCRGFLLGATAGRTTLAGEGLQHQDGQSHLYAATIPNCISYDPTYSFEVAVILREGLRRMYQDEENIFFYITLMNENYVHPAMPKNVEEGIIKGLYCLRPADKKKPAHIALLGSGTILREVEAAADLLLNDFDVTADIYSAPSFNELAREAQDVTRRNHLKQKKEVPYVTQVLSKHEGPILAATDYMRMYTEQIRPYLSQHYVTLGTDGYGRSDTRKALRHFFEVDAKYIALASLQALVDTGALKPNVLTDAMKKYQINPDKPNPMSV